jgi:crotonobetainyl-CoA:carnitine CoA-transferase CaiB-like acyl-CoA transferase
MDHPDNGPKGPLDGLRVVDLTTVVMGPYATVMLADLGAEVIKVEPLDGDMSRSIGAQRHTGMSAMTLNLQRNKRSVALDLSSLRGQEVLRRMCADADVLVTNLRPKSRAKLGLVWEELRAVNPALVFCTAQAYGSDSERANAPAYDDIVQAASGAARLAERVEGSPRYAPYVIADKVAGLHIVVGILAAVTHSRRTGEGQAVDVPMVDTMIAFNLLEHFGGHTFSPPEGDFGWARVLVPERLPHRTSDGWVCILPYSDANWRDFFEVAGLQQMAENPRYATMRGRHQHMGELLSSIHSVTPSRTTSEWLSVCADRNIPASELLDLEQAPRDPYVRAQGLLEEREHPTEGSYYSTRTPLALSRTPVTFRRFAPHLGEHTGEVLGSLGYSDAELQELAAAGVIGLDPDGEVPGSAAWHSASALGVRAEPA